jgi:hypothetical protein
MEMGLSLLATTSMPLKFWDQTFLVATHLINHTPTNILDYDTPLHRLLGATPDYTNLCVFGCACWSNLRPYNSYKLQYRSKRCAFLGYSNLHKGYKCLDISIGRIYISHDVIFYEGIFPFAALHPTVGARYTADVLIPRANSDLPVINSPPAANTNELNMWTHQLLQPQTIPPSCVDDGHWFSRRSDLSYCCNTTWFRAIYFRAGSWPDGNRACGSRACSITCQLLEALPHHAKNLHRALPLHLRSAMLLRLSVLTFLCRLPCYRYGPGFSTCCSNHYYAFRIYIDPCGFCSAHPATVRNQ